MSKSVIVIGSGIGGLAAAIRLAKKGYIVSVFEANDYPGGKLTEVKLGKYRFDAGPSLLTLPEHIEELFELHGLESKDYFRYNKLDTTCQYFYPDGTEFTAWSDKEKILTEFERKLGEPKENIEASLNQSSLLY